MKKLFLASLLILGFVFTGCSSKTSGAKYKVAINKFADHPSLDNCQNGFIEGIEIALGAGNIEFDIQSAASDMALANQIASAQASDDVDLMCGIATPAAQASYNVAEASGIPLVYTAVSEPVAAALADENGFGKGATGTSDKLPLVKQVNLIKTLMPDVKTIGVLYTTDEINSIQQLAELEKIATENNIEVVSIGVSTGAEIPQALESLLPQVDCINNLLDNTVVQSLSLILSRAKEESIPVFGSEIEQVKMGCVASEGIDYVALGIKTGEMAARVLQGEDINTIKFEQIENSETYANKEMLDFYKMTLPSDIKVTFVDDSE